MADTPPGAILCLASYEKGAAFLRECKRQGWQVLLLTATELEHADWPRESIDEIFYMPDLSDVTAVTYGVAYVGRTRGIERIVALDDYDVETAAALREHLRLPGLGASATRYVRDKLAMRQRAHERGILVPEFVHVLNDERLRAFTARVPPPWLLKPRAEVSTIGITRIASPEELWERRDALGDRQSFYLLERYLPGAVYHVDSIITGGQIVFAEAHQYGRPPLDVFHEGGISITHTVRHGSDDERALLEVNARVVDAVGLLDGVCHAEFIKADAGGRCYFLEVGARVGGAYIANVVEAATGVNLWAEWARIETDPQRGPRAAPYRMPERRHDYAGAILSLARQEAPDTSEYDDPEIMWRLDKRHHAGFVVASPDYDRLMTLLDDYSRRFAAEFTAVLPPWESRPASGG
jgi:biotin carboxylase